MKKSKNPFVINLTSNTFEREMPLSNIPHILREDGSKGCVWCGDDLKTKHPLQRYCKDPLCPKSAYIWGYPQREESLFFNLKRQEFKCNICQHDYKQYFSDGGILDILHFGVAKNYIPKERKLEVDHIIPIMSSGQSLGWENHQSICYLCHKEKTKKDVKGVKREKTLQEIQKLKDKKTMIIVNQKLGDFLKEHYGRDFEENWKRYQSIFLMERLTIEEIECKIRGLEKYPNRETNGFDDLLWCKNALEKRK